MRRLLLSLLLVLTLLPQACPQQLPLEGEYTNAREPDTPISLYWKGGKLIYETERHVPVALTAISPTEFALPESQIHLFFEISSSGHPTALYTVEGQQRTAYPRTGAPVRHIFHNYKRHAYMIPMRDGIKLHTIVLTPKDVKAPLPFLIQRTPYGIDNTSRASFFASRPELARDAYIYVAQDIRGRHKSQGEFIMSRPLADHHNPAAVDESTDAYDTVTWLLTHIKNNNGRAGFIGTSYPGFLAMMAGIDPHPATRAVSPQAPMINVWMGDDYFHNGAFRQSYGYDYVLEMESTKNQIDVDYGRDAEGFDRDGFDYFLERGSFAEDVRRSGAKKQLPTWQRFLEHPAYDATWSTRGVEQALNRVAVPTLSVGGTYDQEDLYGPQAEYAALEPHDTNHQNFLVLGPWMHGYWSTTARHLAHLDYTRPIGKEFRLQIEAPFFAKYLKDQPGFDLEDTATFETGSNQWRRYSHFPPAESHPMALHLDANHQLTWTAPTHPGAVSYLSDPANPIPYRHRPIHPTYSEGTLWRPWLTEDQSFLANRTDIATWQLPTLPADLTLTGEVTANLYSTTTGSDGDWVVKLIDQYPLDDPNPEMRGYQLMIAEEIFRGRYLAGFDRPTPLIPGAVNHLRFSLHDIDHTFKSGHRLLVTVQSSWFPLYDRNPQRFVPNIMTAKPEDFQKATITVLSGPAQDSTLELPINGPCPAAICPATK